MAAQDVGSSGSCSDQESAPQGSAPAFGLTWRLRGRSTFAALRSRGRHQRGALLQLTWLDDGSTPPRVGYAIGKRVGGAVERNRLKRRLRAIICEMARAESLPTGAWLIGARMEAVNASGDALREELEHLMTRIGRGGKR